MKTRVTEYSAFEDLIKDEQTALEVLSESLAQDEPAVFIALLGQYVRSKGVAQIAERTGLSRESLYKSISGSRNPRWETICKIIQALDLELQLSSQRTTEYSG